jgi:hypothetical protein
LLYARILSINPETRSKLFWLIDELSKSNVRDKGHTGFPFPEWAIEIRGGPSRYSRQYIWPWSFEESPDAIRKPKVYKATLQLLVEEFQYFDIYLKMAFGQERILAPSSFLIALHSYCETSSREELYELAIYLWQINEFYKSPDNVSLGHEARALIAATDAVRSGNLIIP